MPPSVVVLNCITIRELCPTFADFFRRLGFFAGFSLYIINFTNMHGWISSIVIFTEYSANGNLGAHAFHNKSHIFSHQTVHNLCQLALFYTHGLGIDVSHVMVPYHTGFPYDFYIGIVPRRLFIPALQ